MKDEDKKWYLREIARELFKDGDLNYQFGKVIDGTLPIRQEHGDEGFDEVFSEFEEKVLELFDY